MELFSNVSEALSAADRTSENVGIYFHFDIAGCLRRFYCNCIQA
jgi:hypothetical protein